MKKCVSVNERLLLNESNYNNYNKQTLKSKQKLMLTIRIIKVNSGRYTINYIATAKGAVKRHLKRHSPPSLSVSLLFRCFIRFYQILLLLWSRLVEYNTLLT